MSGIWPEKTGHVPDIVHRCPEYGQEALAMFRTSHEDVRNRASVSWPYSGHQTTMSGTGPGKAGHIPDITQQYPEHDQKKKTDVRNGASDVRNGASDVRNVAIDVRNVASDVWNRASNVRNMAKNPGPTPDITY